MVTVFIWALFETPSIQIFRADMPWSVAPPRLWDVLTALVSEPGSDCRKSLEGIVVEWYSQNYLGKKIICETLFLEFLLLLGDTLF
jgi:hypothetical protein